MADRLLSEADVAAVLDRAWAHIVRFPRATVCRHWAALQVMSAMEDLGCAPPSDIIRAVVDSDDEIALAWSRPTSVAA